MAQETTWFSAVEQPALRDFWAVWDANFGAVLGALVPMAPEREDSLWAGTQQRLRVAMAGDWAGYEVYLDAQAADYARRGLRFETWQELLATVVRRLTPLLVRTYAADPDRLSAALVAMHQFGSRAIAVLAAAFIREREAIGSEGHVLGILVDSVTDYAIFMLDLSGNVVTWNRGAERLLQYESRDVLGKHCSLFYSAEDTATGLAASELRGAATEERTESEGWRVRRDGSRFWADIVITPVRNDSGELVGFAKVARDLTARKAAEKALSDAHGELEAFSYSVAHDLRAPLRGMSGFAQVLLDTYGEKLDAEGKDWLNEILVNAKKMGALIDALLSLSRVTRGELSLERLDLSLVAHDVAEKLEEAEPARAVTIAVEPRLLVEMDGPLARVLLDNLLGNAWKFSATANAARIEFGVVDAPGDRTFFVRDNGAGFDMAYAGKLFAPFQRLHTVAEFPGTGIGLATAQRIVRRHGGRIWAEGIVGGGATFYFTLPRTAAERTP